MEMKLKKVYYCDYCKKKGMSASAMSKHEKHCTANPNRECRMCENSWNYSLIAKEFKKRYKIISVPSGFSDYNLEEIKWIKEPIIINEIHDIVEGCPMCILTIMRLAGLTNPILNLSFDYHEAVNKRWAEINKEMAREDEISTYY